MSIIYFIICLIFLIIFASMLALKEYRCKQDLRRNIKRREEDNYNRWLHKTGLHETSYYFNPSGIRILNDWILWKKNVLGGDIL